MQPEDVDVVILRSCSLESHWRSWTVSEGFVCGGEWVFQTSREECSESALAYAFEKNLLSFDRRIEVFLTSGSD